MTRTEEDVKDYINTMEKARWQGWTIEDIVRNTIMWADNTRNPWHDAETDPPKNGNKVIGLWYNKGLYECVAICVYSRKNKNWNRASAPQFWMQKPELPKEMRQCNS